RREPPERTRERPEATWAERDPPAERPTGRPEPRAARRAAPAEADTDSGRRLKIRERAGSAKRDRPLFSILADEAPGRREPGFAPLRFLGRANHLHDAPQE